MGQTHRSLVGGNTRCLRRSTVSNPFGRTEPMRDKYTVLISAPIYT